MKKIIYFLTTFFTSKLEFSQTFFTVNHITYEVTSSNTVKTTSYDIAGGPSVNIPETVMYDGIDYSVTSIGLNSFSNKGINSVILPTNIITINNSAFKNNNLTKIVIPENVTTIEFLAFQGNPINTVTSKNTTPPLLPNPGMCDAFDNRNSINLFIPKETPQEYTTNTGERWTGFNTVTKGIEFSVTNSEKLNGYLIKIISTKRHTHITFPETMKLKYYEIYNLLGKTVANGTSSKFQNDFLVEGIYIINLFFKKGVAQKKMVITR